MRLRPGIVLLLVLTSPGAGAVDSPSPADMAAADVGEPSETPGDTSQGALNASPWRLCPAIAADAYEPPPAFPEDQQDDTRVSAERVENAASDVATFSGNVLIEKHRLRLRADQAVYDRNSEQLDLTGHIQLDRDGLSLKAREGRLNLESDSGAFSDIRYFLPDAHFYGQAPSISVDENQQTRLLKSRFSSCPGDAPDWSLDTDLLVLDQQQQVGTAKHAVLWFKGVPVFYSPYLSFPIGDQRRSGFLMPSFGTSSSRGFEFALPWYWNIAPNQDATFTPTYMRRRGTLLGTEYRFLTENSRGNLELEYLDRDRVLDEKRYLIKYTQHNDLGADTDVDLLLNDASDSRYLKDMSSNIGITSTTHLERRATIRHRSGPWIMRLMGQSYETIDDLIALDDRPYRRLPQITLNGSDELGGDLLWSLDSEWVNFKHESDNRSQGQRFDIYPKLSWPIQGTAWFIKPSVGVRHTQYSVTDSNGDEIPIENRNLAISSLDAGLFFERQAGEHTLQTLEPRIFYLNIPYEDQSNIPLFDTGDLPFSFAQLFRENRFNGIDRIGDANQLSLGMTTRLLDTEDGTEHMSFSIGQIYYYDDRRVSLDNTTVTSNNSDVVSELGIRLQHWSFKTTLQWAPEANRMDQRNSQLHYESEHNRIFNLAYRFRRDPLNSADDIEQTDVSFSWPIASRYALMGRWNYSLTEERDIANLIGFEYDSCCWTTRLVAQRYLTDDVVNPYDTSIMLQLIFKGLGSVHGKKAGNALENAILGYESDY